MQKSAGFGSMGLTKTAWPRRWKVMGVLWLAGRKSN